MPVRRMRVEVFDESGNRYTISLEGRVTRDKAVRILDMVELLGGMPGVEQQLNYSQESSKIDKIFIVLQKHFPLVWFSAKDLQPIYEKEIGEPIGLSTVATYLSRIADRGMLIRNRSSNRVSFRLISKDLRKIIRTT